MADPESFEDHFNAFWRDYLLGEAPQETKWSYPYSLDDNAFQASHGGHQHHPVVFANRDMHNSSSLDGQDNTPGIDTNWTWNEAFGLDPQTTFLPGRVSNDDYLDSARVEFSPFSGTTSGTLGSLATSSEQTPPSSCITHDGASVDIEGAFDGFSSSSRVKSDRRRRMPGVSTGITDTGSSRVRKSGRAQKPKTGEHDTWKLDDKIDKARSQYATLIAERQQMRKSLNSLMGISHTSTANPPPPGCSKQSYEPGETDLTDTLANRNSQIRSEIKMIKLQIDIRTGSQKSSGGSTTIQR
ncbi:hypothetical protein V866_005624 [Kwoniella sp. B9012]